MLDKIYFMDVIYELTDDKVKGFKVKIKYNINVDHIQHYYKIRVNVSIKRHGIRVNDCVFN
jgi:hypothetical protein